MDDVMEAERSLRRRGGRGWGRAAAVAGVLGLASAVVGVAGAQTGDAPERSASGSATTEAQAEVFVGLSPTRVLDTRATDGGPIGVPAGKLGPTQSIDLALTGNGKPLPPEATSAVMNVTVDQDASLKSFLTIWPKGETRPNASANNAEPGLVASNSMIARLGADDSVSIYNHQGDTNVIIDVVGYLVPADAVEGLGQEFLVAGAAPAAGDGDDGDMWLDNTTNTLYGPKANGQWGSSVANLGGGGGGGGFEGWGAADINAPIALSEGTWVTLHNFSTGSPNAYILQGAVTITQTSPAGFDGIPVHVQCRWTDDQGGELGLVSETMSARDTLTPPNTAFLGPQAVAQLDSDQGVVLQCRIDSSTANGQAFTVDSSYTVDLHFYDPND